MPDPRPDHPVDRSRTATALVLSGGSSRRLGRDKTAEQVGGRTLLGRVIDALTGTPTVGRIVVVGPAGDETADTIVRERPPGGGPVAALVAGLAEADTAEVIVVAGDLPFLTPAAFAQLRRARHGDVAVAVDENGRDQYLLAVWSTAALQTALAAVPEPAGARLGALYRSVQVDRVELVGDPPPWFDCDTEADLARARELVRR